MRFDVAALDGGSVEVAARFGVAARFDDAALEVAALEVAALEVAALENAAFDVAGFDVAARLDVAALVPAFDVDGTPIGL